MFFFFLVFVKCLGLLSVDVVTLWAFLMLGGEG